MGTVVLVSSSWASGVDECLLFKEVFHSRKGRKVPSWNRSLGNEL
jgi:hypothetical protein